MVVVDGQKRDLTCMQRLIFGKKCFSRLKIYLFGNFVSERKYHNESIPILLRGANHSVPAAYVKSFLLEQNVCYVL